MPLTKKGRKIMGSMKEQYGPDRGEAVFYASKNKGIIEGVERKKDGGMVMGMKKYEKGGDVEYLPVPMEPDEETMIKIEEERKKSVYTTANEIEGKMAGDRVKRRGDDRAVKTFRDGGMVRGCKSVQMSGKGFKGTF